MFPSFLKENISHVKFNYWSNYSGVLYLFTGVDMCADPDTNSCDINAICISTTISNTNDKGFVCLCNSGYTGSGEIGNCTGT